MGACVLDARPIESETVKETDGRQHPTRIPKAFLMLEGRNPRLLFVDESVRGKDPTLV